MGYEIDDLLQPYCTLWPNELSVPFAFCLAVHGSVSSHELLVCSFTTIFKNMLFSLFGVVELSDFVISDAAPPINVMSQILFACYEWMMIIILINILIARMSETYDDMAVSSVNSYDDMALSGA